MNNIVSSLRLGIFISRVQAKLFHREWIGKFLFLTIIGFIGYYILYFSTDLFSSNNKFNLPKPSGELYMPTVFPYTVAFLFSVLQYFPLIFLAASFFFKGKTDTKDALQVRQTGNIVFYTAAAGGLIRVVGTWGIVAFMMTMIIHLSASMAPFNGWLYGYYFITMVIPAAVFITGLAFVIFPAVKNPALGIIILFAIIGSTLHLEGESWKGVMNFTGINLPNEYSEITGFANRETYLLQRVGWMIAGIALTIFSALFEQRPENTPKGRSRNGVAGIGVLLVGGICLAGTWGIHEQKHDKRKGYIETYNRYANQEKLDPIEHEIDITPKGNTLTGRARILLLNRNGKPLKECILYLNPALKVETLHVDGKICPFQREKQVIIIPQKIADGDTMHVDITYSGKIDGDIFYLDVPERETRDPWTWNTGLCYKGKEYFYLEEEQIVLFPEALWYPVCAPPVNPASPYAVETHFSRYTLNVHEAGNKTVISQGKMERKGNTITFHPEHPLHGITLVAGHYEKRSLHVDSVDFEIYFYPGHSKLLEPFLGYSAKSPRSYKHIPFQHLQFVETPKLLASYYRTQRGGSNLVQPEMVCFPERMPTKWDDRWQIKKMEQTIFRRNTDFDAFINNLTRNEYIHNPLLPPRQWLSHPLSKQQKDPKIMNPLYIAPYSHLLSFSSKEFPGLGELIFSAAKHGYNKATQSTATCVSKNYQAGLHFLTKHCLQDGLQSSFSSPDFMHTLIELKTDEFYSLFNRQGIANYRIDSFLQAYLPAKRFQMIETDSLQAVIQQAFRVDLKKILQTLYAPKTCLPAFMIKDLKLLVQKKENNQETSPALCSFSVYNDSDTDGIITLRYASHSIPNNNRYFATNQTIQYLIPAGKGKKITRYIPSIKLSYASLLFGFSENEPIDKIIEETIVHTPFLDTINQEELITREDFLHTEEIVIDNNDNGFSLKKEKQPLLQQWFKQEEIETERVQTDIPRWQSIHDADAFGYIKRSIVGRPVTNSDSDAKWETILPESGIYEVFIYHADLNTSRSISDLSYYQNIKTNQISQYYTVKHGNKKTNVTLTHDKNKPSRNKYWHSVGTFYFPADSTSSVTLHNKGIEGQIIWADAVMWRKIEK